MPTVRTTCPTCDTVVIDAGALTLRRRFGAEHAECSFVCPECVQIVVQALNDQMVPVLIGAGCLVEDWDAPDRGVEGARALHPSSGGITEAEIEDFRASLDHDDWYGELLG